MTGIATLHRSTMLIRLAKFAMRVVHITRPIAGQYSVFDIPVKRGMWPIRNLFDIPMFNGIDMNVINVSRKIKIITNRMFPIAPLPNAPFAFIRAAFRDITRMRNAA